MKSTKDKLIVVLSVVVFMAVTGAAIGLTSRSGHEVARDEISAAEMVFPKDKITVQTAAGQDYPFAVELALTPAQQQQGMMWRESLDEGAGMLFIFEGAGEKTFWMKNTPIPLDIIHIDEDGIIGHIHHMAKPQDERQLTAKVPTKAVLEINGGQAERLGIKTGDRVLHPVFRNILADP